jgi:putative peptide zinc metalloprotease protein
MPPSASPAAVGQPAPLFSLPSLLGSTVELSGYRGRRNVIVWFSRGFTCPYCLDYMNGIIEGYATHLADHTEVIQVAPNLLEGAKAFFGPATAPYPFVCDPDKRLYAVYGLGDRGALEASRTAMVSFSHAVAQGEGGTWVRGAWHDVANRNFVRRLHHHAMTAFEQGLFFIDRQGIIRHRMSVGPIEAVPPAAALADLTRVHCEQELPA